MGKNCNEKKLKGKVLIKKIEEKNSCIQNKKIQKMREMEKSFNEKKLKRKEDPAHTVCAFTYAKLSTQQLSRDDQHANLLLLHHQ